MFTVKKFLSMFLVLAMVAAITAVPFSTSAASSNVREWKYFNASEKKLYSSYNEGTSIYGGKVFQVSGTAENKNVAYFENGVDGVTNDPVFNITCDRYLSNYNTTDGVLKTKKNQVLNFNFKVYVPNGKLAAARDISITAGNASSSGAKFTLTNASGENYIKAGGYNTYSNVYWANNTTYTLSADTWHDISIRISVTNGKIWYAMYYDNNLVGVSNSNETVASMSEIQLKQIIFNCGGVDTYIKDIRLDAEDYNVLSDIGGELFFVHLSSINVDSTAGTVKSNSVGLFPNKVLQTDSFLHSREPML